MKFVYNIPDAKDIDTVTETFSTENNPGPDQKILLKVVDNDEIAIFGNEAGWLFLAKICVEMAYCNKRDPLYHIHKKANLANSMKDGEEKVSFYAIDES